MRILAVDPGTAVSGYAVIDYVQGALRPLTWGAARTSPRDAMPARLLALHRCIQQLVDEYKPSVVAVEQLFFNRNASSALQVGQARGVVLLAAALHGIPVAEFTPLQVKQAVTGLGRATKQQVGYMVKALLKLEELPTPDDVTDALAVAICCAHFAPPVPARAGEPDHPAWGHGGTGR